MIKIKVTTSTRDANGNSALPIVANILLNITPHFRDRVEVIDEVPTTIYSVSFDATPYKDMAAYNNNDVLVNSDMFEYPIGHTIDNVDIQDLTNIDSLLDLYRTIIEDGTTSGANTYSGVGSGNTELIYPAT